MSPDSPAPPRTPRLTPCAFGRGGFFLLFEIKGLTTWQYSRIVFGVDTITKERQKVLALYEAGQSVREIAKTLDVSTQRIYQQLKALELPAPGKENA